MNSTTSKTFYTCSAESILEHVQESCQVRYFFQCSVHIFLGRDGCVLEINLRAL